MNIYRISIDMSDDKIQHVTLQAEFTGYLGRLHAISCMRKCVKACTKKGFPGRIVIYKNGTLMLRTTIYRQ